MTRFRTTHRLFTAAALGLLLGALSAGCARVPAKTVEGYTPAAGEQAAITAAGMIGRPYRYRGESPSGFDCSGLVRYSYRSAGIDVPHGTQGLISVTSPVGSLQDARKGDLLFFSQQGRNYSHVGIYVGDDSFVHAPSTGGFVRRESMNDPYWRQHYQDIRRFP